MLGTTVGVRADTAVAAEAIGRLLAHFWTPDAAEVAHRYSLTASGLERDDALILASDSWSEVLDGLLGDLNRTAIGGFDGLAVHAGVVARGQAVVVFPAPSGAGKSTLTAACLSAGCHYLSDEALCVDFERDAVIPYPKPLRLSGQAAALIGLNWRHDGGNPTAVVPEDLGATVATGPLRLDHVVQLVRRPGPPVLRPMERSESVARLLSMSFNHYRAPRLCFALASRLAARAESWRLEYDAPRPAAALLRALLDEGAERV